MKDDFLKSIDVLASRVAVKEEEVNKLKRLVNELCREGGMPDRYGNIADAGTTARVLRPDQFYGQTLTAACRSYLEFRKAANLGAATVTDIYAAIREGGYKFDTKNEENAKISVGNALRKTSSVFHRLPNGQYGLLAWYPSAKAPPQDGNGIHHRSRKRKPTGNVITNKEIRDVILSHGGEYQASDIEAAIKAKFPGKELPKAKVPTVIHILKKKGLVRQVAARIGKKGAVYSKA